MNLILKKIEELKQRFLKIKKMLKLEAKETKAQSLRLQMAAPYFWNNQAEAIAVSQEAEEILTELNILNSLEKEIIELEELCALAGKENNNDLEVDLEHKYVELENAITKLEFNSLFDGEHDKANAFISIHAGTGGVDAQDWAQMLQRMFLRFCERKNFKVSILDINYGNEAGIKSADIKIVGPYAYGYFKSENGTHRLLRNSPFNADGLRQTSFALVEVIPELKEQGKIEIKDEDLKIDVYRSSGPGGQSVNTTDSAVRITHLPSGLVVACQNERSQHQNKENALSILQNKLNKLALEEREAKEKDLKGDSKAEWGRQIRSYFLYGNRLVKDHRSNFETSDVDSVLDGDLEAFMEAYLRINK